MNRPDADDQALFDAAQARLRRRRMLVALAMVLGIAAAGALAMRWTAAMPCESLATQFCALGGIAFENCGPMQALIANADPALCAATLDQLGNTSSGKMKMWLVSTTLPKLVPDAESYTRALRSLPPATREAFMQRLDAVDDRARTSEQ